MLFMVIERFKNRDARAVYRRFQEKGRMAPAGLQYVGSWIEANFDRCFSSWNATTRGCSSSGSSSGKT